jgi:hypothetical protein
LIPELEPFHNAHLIDDLDRDNTEDEQLRSEFENGEIIRIYNEESKVMQDEESQIRENIAHVFII